MSTHTARPARKIAAFDEEVKAWAEWHKISEPARDKLRAFILAPDLTILAHAGIAENFDALIKNFNAARTALYTPFSLEKRTRPKKIQTQARNLHRVLSHLEPDTICVLAKFLHPKSEGDQIAFASFVPKLLKACALINKLPCKEILTGHKEARVIFVRFLAACFSSAVGERPTSTPSGCFVELVSIAFEYHGIVIDDISRDIQQALRRDKPKNKQLSCSGK